jgi:hypothetical protein
MTQTSLGDLSSTSLISIYVDFVAVSVYGGLAENPGSSIGRLCK